MKARNLLYTGIAGIALLALSCGALQKKAEVIPEGFTTLNQLYDKCIETEGLYGVDRCFAQTKVLKKDINQYITLKDQLLQGKDVLTQLKDLEQKINDNVSDVLEQAGDNEILELQDYTKAVEAVYGHISQ